MRHLAAVIAFALLVAACGGGTETVGTSGSTTAGTDAPVSTTSVGEEPSGGSDAPTTTAERLTGPAAPEFTLALGEGGSFTLSDAQKPVYMVFWAEW